MEGWREEMRARSQGRTRWRDGEQETLGISRRKRDVFWLRKKEKRKTREICQHEHSVKGLGGTRWETHAVKYTHTRSSERGWSPMMTS